MPNKFSNKEQHQRNTCFMHRKLREETAIRHATNLGPPTSPYVCAGCNKWHIGRRAASPFHNADYRLPDPFIFRNKYLDREREKKIVHEISQREHHTKAVMPVT